MLKRKKLLLQLDLNNTYLYQITSDKVDHCIVIGRDPSCEWRIPATDKTASNRHAEIYSRRGKLYIHDLNSHNGLFYLGNKIQERVLAVGERYGIGDAILIVSELIENEEKSTHKFHRLEQLNGKNRKKIYELSEDQYIIGSAGEANIMCTDSMISHHHAKLEIKKDGSCWVSDLGSRNGTEVNHMRLSSENTEGRMLQDGDILSIVCVDFRFYDKNVATQKSYFMLKSLCAILTVVILLSGYFFWQSLLPSAKGYVEKARKLSEVKQFDAALNLLAESANARHADTYRTETNDLKNQIKGWKNTTDKWAAIQKMLRNRQWISANKTLVGLLGARNDIWNWNDTDAVEEKRFAKLTSDILEPFLYSWILILRRETTLSELQTAQKKFKTALHRIPPRVPEYFPPILTSANDIYSELSYIITQLRQIDKFIARIGIDSELNVISQRMKKLKSDTLLHNNGRRKKGKAVSKLVMERCGLYLEPLESLASAKTCFEKNLDLAASFHFKGIIKTLSLPTVEQCAASPAFANIRSELISRNSMLQQRVIQLTFMVDALSNAGIQDGKQPAEMEEIHSPEFMKKILSCDCFRYEAKQWTVKRQSPIGAYDRFLGIEVFWEFMRNLPDGFDSSSLEDKPFVPTAAKLRKIYSDLELFKAFLEDPVVALLLTRNIQEPKLQNLALRVDELLSKRDTTIQKWMNDSQTSSELRNSLISGCAALLLNTGNLKSFEKEPERLCELFRKIRRKIEMISKQEASPEQMIKNRRLVVSAGLPGDPIVRQAVNAMTEEKK